MFTKEEQLKLKELTNSNDDFDYFITKSLNECKTLASHICHELRNPLTLIKGTTQLIESNNPEIHDIKYWDQLKEDIHELELLLAEFSTYNHSESIKKQNQNFLLLLKAVINTFRPLTEQKGIDLSLNIEDNAIPFYTSYPFDQIKMKQVFTNLISNALDATQTGNYINVDCAVSDNNQLRITVSNNGNMIPADILPTIFTPFVSYKSGGSGLGLAITSNIIIAHDGTITSTSTKDKTEFCIQLPIVE